MSSHSRKPFTRRKAAIGVVLPLTLCSALALAVNGFATTSSKPERSASDAAGKNAVVLEKDAQAFLDATVGLPPFRDLSAAEARKILEDAQSGPVDKLPADISERTLPVGPTGEVSIRIVRPEGAKGKLPAVMYLHGGGWVLGDADTHDRLVRQIANGAHAAVVFVNYSRSPEARFPIAIEQAYAATRWVSQHGDEIGVDGERLAVAGDSVGGNMSAAVTLMAKQRGGPALRQQVLFYPVTDAKFDTPSYKQFANGFFLTRDNMQFFWDSYAPDPKVRNDILASPLRASLDQLKGLPKALVVTGEADVLRDEGEAYAAKLRAAGNDVTTIRNAGITHDYVMLDALSKTNAARVAVDQATAALRTAFDTES
ncbi:alpha/beta hydrolase [Streptomyces sp. GQFP]|uniref:alpha/beta hydrolase n=1 Tax=Streptomyces sp. GQFP TaxID=2907545 RepID=UPI001F1C2EC4|nr:alpha/beta hydrolase [Streptomyces sp. GQFP]UIX34728.1 alpha/beta hydrolase [Streptomyces sp. GQFP]